MELRQGEDLQAKRIGRDLAALRAGCPRALGVVAGAQIESGLLKELLTRRGDQDAMKVIRDFVLDSYAMGRPLSPSFAEAQIG